MPLEEVSRLLKEKYDIDVNHLAVLLMLPNEMVIGEVLNLDPEMQEIAEKKVIVKNPKRLTRLNLIGQNGQSNVDLRMSDFDFIQTGVIQLKPMGGFFLTWLDEPSALAYARGYLGFEEGRIIAKARAAGIVPGAPNLPESPILIKGR